MMIMIAATPPDVHQGGHFEYFRYNAGYSDQPLPAVAVASRYGRRNKVSYRGGSRTPRSYLNNGFTANPFTEDDENGIQLGAMINVAATEFHYAMHGNTVQAIEKFTLNAALIHAYTGLNKYHNNWNRTPASNAYTTHQDATVSPLTAFVVSKMNLVGKPVPANYAVRAFVCWDKHVQYQARWVDGDDGAGKDLVNGILQRQTVARLAYVSNFMVLT